LIEGWMDEWMEGWMDVWMDDWMGEYLDGWLEHNAEALNPQGFPTPRRGLVLSVKPKVRTINPPLVLWAVEPRNTRHLWDYICVLVAPESIQM